MKRDLTAKLVDNAALPKDGVDRIYYWDAKNEGLGLMVTGKGAKSWVFQYRHEGKTHRMTLKGFPPLADARKQAHEYRHKLNNGQTPQAKPTAGNTFAEIADRFLKLEAAKTRSHRQYQGALRRSVLPAIGTKPITAIKRSDIVQLIDAIPGEASQDLVFAVIRRIFSWHESRSDDFRSPIARGMHRSTSSERARSRTLSDYELGRLWNATAGQRGPFEAYCRYLLLTGARRMEAAAMQWSELDGETWVIPAKRYKTKCEHAVPLSGAAMETLANLPRIGPGKYVFTMNGQTPMGGISTRKKAFDKVLGFNEPWNLHDLRRTARSLMSRAGVLPHIAELCLGHAQTGIVKIYDRYSYLDEKRDAFEKLASLIAQITAPLPQAA